MGKISLIWKNKKHIFEGIKNNIFKKEHIEVIAAERMAICLLNKCDSYDPSGEGCLVSGTHPCCNKNNGGCGCSLMFATRALSKECPKGYWEALLTEDEEDKLNSTIND